MDSNSKINCYKLGNRGVDRKRWCGAGYGSACGTCSKKPTGGKKQNAKSSSKPATVTGVTIEDDELFMNNNIMAPF